MSADLDVIREVATHHRAELLVRSQQLAHDGRFVTGAAWAVRALDRILLALDGVDDREALGLDQYLDDPDPVGEPEGLFEVGG